MLKLTILSINVHLKTFSKTRSNQFRVGNEYMLQRVATGFICISYFKPETSSRTLNGIMFDRNAVGTTANPTHALVIHTFFVAIAL